MYTSIALWQDTNKLFTCSGWPREVSLTTTEKVTFPTDTVVFWILNVLKLRLEAQTVLNITVLHFPAAAGFEKNNYYLLANKYVKKCYVLGQIECYSYFVAL